MWKPARDKIAPNVCIFKRGNPERCIQCDCSTRPHPKFVHTWICIGCGKLYQKASVDPLLSLD